MSKGADSRMFQLHNKIYMLTENPIYRMSFIELTISKRDNTITLTRESYVNPQNEHEIKFPHKNWGPFEFNNTLLLIHTVNPLHIIQLVTEPDTPITSKQLYDDSKNKLNSTTNHVITATNMTAVTVSITTHTHKNIHWEFGDIRGGTNAVKVHKLSYQHNHNHHNITLPKHLKTAVSEHHHHNHTSHNNEHNSDNNTQYLAFFHSRHLIPLNAVQTYVYGAYTFTNTPPFQITSISVYPIIHDQFYTGAWVAGNHFDYSNYPTSLHVNESTNSLYLTVGHNDIDGYVLKYQLDSILSSLVSVVV